MREGVCLGCGSRAGAVAGDRVNTGAAATVVVCARVIWGGVGGVRVCSGLVVVAAIALAWLCVAGVVVI